MNYESSVIQLVVVVAIIAAWGFWEYREREIRHRQALLDLKNNVEPEPAGAPNRGKVITTLITGIVLLVVDAGGLVLVERLGFRYGSAVLVMAVELSVVAVLLFMMASRDAGILREG